ncbi:hypothetical protein ONZ43_g2302 [Nemania bipapillata]|uniref:Uncharacterized protein n=1 Tax=Nemania bipapillata TaxID=110536 RepID=A0ACC2J151_9PEZI|nr:hypothetical protein ONZ43_g2302 [Nemania bipapillata]
MFVSKLATTAILLATAIAGPLAAVSTSGDESAQLTKRADGIHLVNCVTYSAVIFCSDDSNCNFNPSSGNECIPKDHLNSKGLEIWEGTNSSCTFSTGVTFFWGIESNAQSQPNFSVVGSGTNSLQGFTIRKDDQHVMYTDGNGHACQSIYYAL